MFELLLFLYLFPVVMLVTLLLKLVIWLIRKACKLVLWIVRTFFVLLGKGMILAFAFIMADKPFNRPPDR